jgi:hypothetical protein
MTVPQTCDQWLSNYLRKSIEQTFRNQYQEYLSYKQQFQQVFEAFYTDFWGKIRS